MIYIGCHISVANGCRAMGEPALRIGADTFAWFTRNPRGGRAKEYAPDDLAALRAAMDAHDFGPLVAHASYAMNLASDREATRLSAVEMLGMDLIRMNDFPGSFLNLHPGAHVGQGVEAGIDWIAGGLNQTLTDASGVTVLLETMTGKGTEVGGRFEELRDIIDRVDRRTRVGVCFDTCHVWDAGYDLKGDLDGVLTRFDKAIGLDRLKAVHLNDSKNPCGARKDRHEKLGRGEIGPEALKRVVRHPALQGLPFILETPNEEEGYAEEIRTVRRWMEKG